MYAINAHQRSSFHTSMTSSWRCRATLRSSWRLGRFSVASEPMPRWHQSPSSHAGWRTCASRLSAWLGCADRGSTHEQTGRRAWGSLSNGTKNNAPLVNGQAVEKNEGLRPHIRGTKTPDFVHVYRGISPRNMVFFPTSAAWLARPTQAGRVSQRG